MKKLLILTICIFTLHSAIGQATFCINLSEFSNDGSTVELNISMQGSVAFDLGASNLQIWFDLTEVGNPQFVSTPLPGFYQVTVTTPFVDEASINFNLPANFGLGAEVSGPGAFTQLARISFDILPGQTVDLNSFVWTYDGSSTGTVVFTDTPTVQIYATNNNPDCLVTLPLNLLSFSLDKINKTSSHLSWEIDTDRLLERFEVYRSTPGNRWVYLTDIKAIDNRNKMTYDFVDEDVFDGFGTEYYYYKLKIIDKDGQYYYSEIKNILFSNDADTDVLLIYPNPSSGDLYFTLKDYELNKEVGISVFDTNGKMLFTENTIYNGGKDKIKHLNSLNLKSGVYQLVVEDESKTKHYGKFIFTR